MFITLGPSGTCHEHALLRYLEFQGLEGARVELVGDFEVGLERVHEEPNGFLLQCSSHPEVHIVTERYRQEVFVIDTFMFPAKEMGLSRAMTCLSRAAWGWWRPRWAIRT